MAELIRDRLAVVDAQDREILTVDARNAVLDLGATGNEGDLRIRGNDGAFTFHFDGGRQLLIVRDAQGRDVLHFDGSNSHLIVGATGNDGDIYVNDAQGHASIHLDGAAGDILLQNADCAEDFDCSGTEVPPPGSVVVLDDRGAVTPCLLPYDRSVVGIVSGAGDYRPGIVLDRRPNGRVRVPVAMMGKVFCHVDARHGQVRVGDLLTTSTTPGHAMVAADMARAAGTVVGKALGSLPAGMGLIPVLAALH